MTKKKTYPTETYDITIESINDRGNGYARITHPPVNGHMGAGLQIFVPHVAPGDKVRVSVPNAKGRRRASVFEYELLEAGPHRDPEFEFNPDFSGGTPLIAMSYEAQLDYKQQMIEDYLDKVGVDKQLIRPIIGMDQPFHYRNKMELTFGIDGSLGMHAQGNYKKVVDLKDSVLATQDMVTAKRIVEQWWLDSNLPAYNKETKEGLLRHLILRQSHQTKELMVGIVANGMPENYDEVTQKLSARLTAELPTLTSLLWIENTSISERSYETTTHVITGSDHINEAFCGFTFRIWHDTFFQPNPVQAQKMVEIVEGLIKDKQYNQVVDLYCGIGTFSLPLARQARHLAGIEIVESSIESAKRNAQDNGITNAEFICSEARRGLEALKEQWGSPDLLVLDPPRSGAGGKMMRSIGRYQPGAIIYISCNPKELGNDLIWLDDFGYEVTYVQPVDQFPHTIHSECIVMIEKSDSEKSIN